MPPKKNMAKRKTSQKIQADNVTKKAKYNPQNTEELIQKSRQQFPMIKNTDWIYLENAGGSLMAQQSIDKIVDYCNTCYVQLVARYEASNKSDKYMQKCRDFLKLFFNCPETGEVIINNSTTSLTNILANSYQQKIQKNHEIIVANFTHESTVGPWVKLAEHGNATLKFWQINPQTMTADPEDLYSMINENTYIVSLPHVSNLLGEIVDIKTINQKIKEINKNVKIFVDGVAFAPHRCVDVQDLGVNFYVFSLYKAYGPHMAAMFGNLEDLKELQGPNHFFIDNNDIPYKYELGGLPHELCAGTVGVEEYFKVLLDKQDNLTRQDIVDIYEIFKKNEDLLTEEFLKYINENEDKFKLVGIKNNNEDQRLPFFSIVPKNKTCREVVELLHKNKIGCRNGHMYCRRLYEPLGLDPNDAVIRISAVHYNTVDEIKKVIEVLKQV